MFRFPKSEFQLKDGRVMLVPRIAASAALAGGLLDDPGDMRGGAAQGLLVYQTDGTQGFYYNSNSIATENEEHLLFIDFGLKVAQWINFAGSVGF